MYGKGGEVPRPPDLRKFGGGGLCYVQPALRLLQFLQHLIAELLDREEIGK